MRLLIMVAVLALAAMAFLDLHAEGGTAAGAPAEARVFAHYMPWFKAERRPDGGIAWDHWQWFGKGRKHDPDDLLPDGRRDIASVFYPLIGPYDGRDPKVLEYHLLTAHAAGIEGFIADWYGPGTYTDEVFAELTAAAAPRGMRVAICLEEKAFFPGYAQVSTRAGVLDEMERHLRHVLDTHAKSPAYWRRNGAPVFFIFIGHGESSVGLQNLSPAEVADVLGRLDEKILLVRGHADANYFDVARGSYAWCGDAAYRDWYFGAAGPARREGRLDFIVGGPSPGFDDSGVNGWGRGPRITDRRGTKEYEENWADVLAAMPDAVQVVTWNDFQEGTTVEPAREYGFTFLDLTERFVADYTGRPNRPRDNDWGLRIYRIRERIEEAADRAAASHLAARVDGFADDFVHGRGRLMGWRLAWLERQAGGLASE